jgi:hypothetical protein
MDELIKILDNTENFTIAESIYQADKTPFDLLCIINYLLENIINCATYELETEQDKKDYKELIKIKDKILKIKNGICTDF